MCSWSFISSSFWRIETKLKMLCPKMREMSVLKKYFQNYSRFRFRQHCHFPGLYKVSYADPGASLKNHWFWIVCEIGTISRYFMFLVSSKRYWPKIVSGKIAQKRQICIVLITQPGKAHSYAYEHSCLLNFFLILPFSHSG